MAWTKIPKENHPIFRDALPDDARVETLNMFGGVAGLVNGHMFGGLWATTAVVRLPDDVEVPGGSPFDPTGSGRIMKEMVVLPETIFQDARALRHFLTRGLEYTATLPPKVKKEKKAAATRAPAKRAPTKKAPAKKAPAKKAPAKKVTAKKVTAKKVNGKKKALTRH